MFTWICPQCGREVPPAYTECPDCTSGRLKGSAEPTNPEAPKAQSQAAAAPVAAERASAVPLPEPQQQVFPPLPARLGRSKPRIPTWLLAVLFSVGFLGAGAGVYYLVGGQHGSSSAAPSSAPAATAPDVKANPFQRYIEVSGIRFVQDPKSKDKTQIKYILTNHSEADIQGLEGSVNILGRAANDQEDTEGSFAFKTDIKPFESKEMTSPLDTPHKIYELPDWQNATAVVRITAPEGVSAGSAEPR